MEECMGINEFYICPSCVRSLGLDYARQAGWQAGKQAVSADMLVTRKKLIRLQQVLGMLADGEKA